MKRKMLLLLLVVLVLLTLSLGTFASVFKGFRTQDFRVYRAQSSEGDPHLLDLERKGDSRGRALKYAFTDAQGTSHVFYVTDYKVTTTCDVPEDAPEFAFVGQEILSVWGWKIRGPAEVAFHVNQHRCGK